MLTQNSEWRNHPIRLVFAVADQEQEAKAREKLGRLMEAARVSATLEIVAGPDAVAAMRERSQDAALVLKDSSHLKRTKTSRRWNGCEPRSEICGG